MWEECGKTCSPSFWKFLYYKNLISGKSWAYFSPLLYLSAGCNRKWGKVAESNSHVIKHSSWYHVEVLSWLQMIILATYSEMNITWVHFHLWVCIGNKPESLPGAHIETHRKLILRTLSHLIRWLILWACCELFVRSPNMQW